MLNESERIVKPIFNNRSLPNRRLDRTARGVYNPGVDKPRYLPNADRLSVLAATILLAYALARFVQLPQLELATQLPGFYFSISLNIQTVVAIIVAGLTASGADWLLHDHPARGEQNTIEHWLLPALTAWVIGLPLLQLPIGPLWWGGIALGGGLLMLVLLAEYIVVDPDDIRQPPAAAALTAVSFALYLALVVGLRLANLRLFLLIPALSTAACLVSLRTLHLRLHERWLFLPALVIALMIAQLAAALHYWPISPVSYGLILLGPAYALTSLVSGLEDGAPFSETIREPLIVLTLIWLIALWTR